MSTGGVPSQDEVDTVIAGARRYGGGFAKALFVEALRLADSENRARIRMAFGDLWAKYHGFGVIASAEDKRAAEEAGK
jgi:hypothetical protein